MTGRRVTPYADKTAARLAARERQRRTRQRKRQAAAVDAARTAPAIIAPAIIAPADPVAELAAWARARLVVPPGHPAAGQPMELPAFAEAFLRDGWEAHESALSVARKNAKSAICAILALWCLAGPHALPGWRGAIASVTKEKAAELRAQVAAIAEASGLAGVRVRRSPYPGAILSDTGSLETLSADRTAGHASGFDLVIVDETGLMPERARELLAGLRSSVSAKGGRVLHISVRGDSPLFAEILANPATLAHVYAAPDGCELDDRDAWRAANPGLGTIKTERYMAAEVARLAGAPGDEPAFRAFDLNQALNPDAELIVSPDDLRACFTDAPPPREGAAFLGFDFGEAKSATAAAAIWPATGRMECWMAFGDTPALAKRAKADDAPYAEMKRAGELRIYPGRVTPTAAFLADVAADLAGCWIAGAASDPFKRAEARTFLEQSGAPWEIAAAEGVRKHAADVRAFSRLIVSRQLRMRPSLALVHAIAKHKAHRDAAGNPLLDKRHRHGRIDALSAALIAAGLAEPWIGQPMTPAEPIYV